MMLFGLVDITLAQLKADVLLVTLAVALFAQAMWFLTGGRITGQGDLHPLLPRWALKLSIPLLSVLCISVNLGINLISGQFSLSAEYIPNSCQELVSSIFITSS